MKTTTAFRALTANRKANKHFAVVSVTRKGVPSKMAPSDLCLASTMEQAEAILERMQKLNPGKQFTIVDR